MNYKKIADEIYDRVGGEANIVSATHCATRLRLIVKDEALCDSTKLEEISGVSGVFFASGQLQIILGTGVIDKVFDEFVKKRGVNFVSKDDMKEQVSKKDNLFKRLIKILGDVFIPIIPAIVASGFLMGLMESLNFMVANGYLNINTSSAMYVFAQIFSNTAYVFLPILIGFSTAKVFGGNPFLGAVIGMIMIHPDLQNAWTVASEGILRQQEVFFGAYSVGLVGYQGHVIPVIISVGIMSMIEKKLHKIVPPMIDLFVTPLVSVFVTGYLTLAAVGPIFVWLENALLDGVQMLIAIPLGIGSFIMGGIYSSTVVSGIHHMYTIIDVGQIAKYGFTFWLPLASAANVAQGAAALAVGVKTKNKKLKSMALPSSLSAFMGITEPAIFGVNLRFVRPFIAGSIGGACGALYASIVELGATGTGVTGIFGVLLHLHKPVQYIITMAIAVGVAFIVSWVLWKDEAGANTSEESNVILENPCLSILSPVEGEVYELSSVEDAAFAKGALGQGVAILPKRGRIIAPFNGNVAVLVDSKHAIALKSADGVELLIHIGMDTVKLDGKHFKSYVNSGDAIVKGDLLIEFDIPAIEKEGYNIKTPIVVVNSGDFGEIIPSGLGELAKELDSILVIK